jgi:hypothetical protein
MPLGAHDESATMQVNSTGTSAAKLKREKRHVNWYQAQCPLKMCHLLKISEQFRVVSF